MAAVADDLTLDVVEPQVLLNYPADPNGFTEHHRLLLARLGPGRWIAASPDHELSVVDLNTHRHRILTRRSAFPADVANVVYAFDPLSKVELEGLKRQARAMTVVLGEEDVDEIEELVWVYADADSELLGKPVPVDKMQGAVTLGSRGLVDADGSTVGIEEIPLSETTSFAESKKSTLGDLRLIGRHVDSADKRFIQFKDAFPLLRQTDFKDWQFQGPRAAREFLSSINESGTDLGAYHLQWVKNSGVNTHRSVCHEHRNLVEVVRLALCKDQLDVSNLMCMELVVRRLVQLEVAVSRNSTSPDYAGLDILLENPGTMNMLKTMDIKNPNHQHPTNHLSYISFRCQSIKVIYFNYIFIYVGSP